MYSVLHQNDARIYTKTVGTFRRERIAREVSAWIARQVARFTVFGMVSVLVFVTSGYFIN